jgi:hypothetical protein
MVSHIQFNQTGVDVSLWTCCICHVAKQKIAPINVPLGHGTLVCSSHRWGLNRLRSPLTKPAFRWRKSIKSAKMGSQSCHDSFHHFEKYLVLLQCDATINSVSTHRWKGSLLRAWWQTGQTCDSLRFPPTACHLLK